VTVDRRPRSTVRTFRSFRNDPGRPVDQTPGGRGCL